MKALELKHLAPYLPYGLQVKRITKYDRAVGTKNEYDIQTLDYTILEIMAEDSSPHWTGKPLLRPLSDLTKEIEHNEKKFVPMPILFSADAESEKQFEVYGTIPDYWESALRIDVRFWDYHVVDKLFQWHFDVFGLIEAGLAIEKQ